MKKILILIALIVSSMVSNAQSYFDSLEDVKGVDMVVVTKDAFELISKFKNLCCFTDLFIYLCILKYIQAAYCYFSFFKI